jgi:hypothetical protein
MGCGLWAVGYGDSTCTGMALHGPAKKNQHIPCLVQLQRITYTGMYVAWKPRGWVYAHGS